jgi:hypothetical protein
MTDDSETQTSAKTKTESRMPLRVYLKRFTAHLWLGIRDLWPFWLGICALAAVWLILFYFGYHESCIRLLGMILQLVGFVIVARGLIESGKLFEQPTVRERVAFYFKRFPRRSVTNHFLSPQGISTGAPVIGSARVNVLAGPDTPLEKRVQMLEELTKNLLNEVGKLGEKLGAHSNKLALNITEEVTERKAGHRALEEKLVRAVIGGIHVEWWGVFFFIVGIILASASPEICGQLGNAGNC